MRQRSWPGADRGGPAEQVSAGHGGRRRTVLTASLVAIVLLGALTFAAATVVRSPQQRLAEAAGPGPSTLTAPVERRVLSQTVVVRGTVAGSRTQEVTPGTEEGRQAVVTAVRTGPGRSVTDGSVLLEVAGRPLIALAGSIPAYRDMRPGTRGKDVAELQDALRAVGEDPGESDGYFGPGTKEAVEALYRRLGYEPATTGEADAAAVEAGRPAVRAAERAVEDAVDALAPLQARPASDPTAKAARRALSRAREDLVSARRGQAELVARSGTMVPLAEVVFLPTFPGRVEKSNAAVGAEVKAPLLTLSSGALVARTTLDPADAALVKPGMTVRIASEVLGKEAVGTVTRVGEPVVDAAAGTSGSPLVVGTARPLPAAFGGQDVRLTVETARTAGPVLVVPIAAVYAGVDGRASVLRLVSGDRSERVPVTAGVSGDGYVQVSPASAALKPGDRVVVGS